MSETANAAEHDQNQRQNGPPQFLQGAADATNAGEYDKAIDFLKQGIGQHSFTAYKGIGDILLLRGEGEKALEWLEKARMCNSNSVSVIESIGHALVALGRTEKAVEEFGKSIRKQKEIQNISTLVESMRQTGLGDNAAAILEEMIDADPQRTDLMFELASLYNKMGQLTKAEQWYKKNVELTSSFAAYNNLGVLYRKMGRISDAIECMQKTVKMNPDHIDAWYNLTTFMKQAGDIDEGIELSRTIIEKMPDNPKIHSDFIFSLHYSSKPDQQTIFEEHKKWGQRYAPVSMARTSHSNSPEPDRKIRIGYISPDFRRHVVSHYIKMLLETHNRNAVEVYGYGNVEHPDQITVQLQGMCDQYRDIWNAGDKAVSRIIEQDKIDILVDLAGHTRDNRLLVLAYKPAPVQISYLGYADTSGMEAVDYILTDSIVTPPELQKYYTEEFLPLSRCHCCYKPLDGCPEVNDLPAVKNGYVTFGAFTNISRLNNRLLEAWAEILKVSDDSRLILGFRGGEDKGIRDRFLSRIEAFGVSPDRIVINGLKPYMEYLRQYNEVDIALDSFPENGGTTTCDAMWMGVPVITLAGKHQAGRYGLTFLKSMGLEQFAADTVSQYVSRAADLANDRKKLIELRSSLRLRMAEGELCDIGQFTREIESAYRKIWHRWCRQQGVDC